MASSTRIVSSLGTVFDFNSQRKGTVSFFSNDLNIDWRMLVQGPGILLNLHAGPILFVTTNIIPAGGLRVTMSALSIGSAFPPPPLSLLQLNTDTVLQSPAGSAVRGVNVRKLLALTRKT